jgi:hypothetical protein
MTNRHHRLFWFFAIYGLSLVTFAGTALLIRVLLRWIV